MVPLRGSTMYKLKKNCDNLLDKSFGSDEGEKVNRSVYLTSAQWRFLEDLAEEENVSRNEVLRQLLSEIREEIETGVLND